MKASRFVKPFEADVDRWERTLSHILEVTEMLLTVQRQWMYLEVRYYFYSLLKELTITSLFSMNLLILFVSMLHWVRVHDSDSEFAVVRHFVNCRTFSSVKISGNSCRRSQPSLTLSTTTGKLSWRSCSRWRMFYAVLSSRVSNWLLHLHFWLIIMMDTLVEMLAGCFGNQMLCYAMKACWSSWTQWTTTWRLFRSLSTCIWKLRGKYFPASTSFPTTTCLRFSDSRRIPSRCSLTSRNVLTTSRILPWAR